MIRTLTFAALALALAAAAGITAFTGGPGPVPRTPAKLTRSLAILDDVRVPERSALNAAATPELQRVAALRLQAAYLGAARAQQGEPWAGSLAAAASAYARLAATVAAPAAFAQARDDVQRAEAAVTRAVRPKPAPRDDGPGLTPAILAALAVLAALPAIPLRRAPEPEPEPEPQPEPEEPKRFPAWDEPPLELTP